jgi:hypothetical protein
MVAALSHAATIPPDIHSLAEADLSPGNAPNPALTLATDTTDDDAFADLPMLFDAFNPLEWRREVKDRGKYWQWRKGSGDYRPSRYGGVFELLDEERKAQYERNKRIYGRNQKAKGKKRGPAAQAGAAKRGAGDAAKRDRVLPDQRRTAEVRRQRDGLTPSA